MSFLPLEKMRERVDTAAQDSDTSLFFNLLYLGEMAMKVVTAAMLAAVSDDPERQRYTQVYRLVRANSLGEWKEILSNVLTGPPSSLLIPDARTEKNELTQRCSAGAWQYEAVRTLQQCVQTVLPEATPLQDKASLIRWFDLFVELRNRTRGHGAPLSEACSQMTPLLLDSVRHLVDGFTLFARSWAYLHRNLSGKYRVTALSSDASVFDRYRTTTSENLANGIYVHFGSPVRVELIESGPDATDFLFPNGAFNEKAKKFELLSYITDDKREGDGRPYSLPPGQLPKSETQGLERLDPQGNCFGNLPPLQQGYVNRRDLEGELANVLRDERHPVITLVGRGGIGKTCLALSVLRNLASDCQFEVIVWFSARDIDLLLEGPKAVRRHVRTERDIADEFARLMQPCECLQKGFDAVRYFSGCLAASPVGPMLFVFDNFETVESPVDLYTWLDTHIRLPNKVLITTRQRAFKGDYPVTVSGMNEEECNELIDSVGRKLGISDLVTPDWRERLFSESEGHPYVIRILLGEIAGSRRLDGFARIVASRGEILEALFERTYQGLSPGAQRVFLTLSSWRSVVALLALEAVLLRPANEERINVSEAIEELARSSFIELAESRTDGHVFVSVPLAASLFGKTKLKTSLWKRAIESDTQLLQDFGAAQGADVQRGVAPRIERFFQYVADRCVRTHSLAEYLPMLEFLASKYPNAWMHIARLHEELALPGGVDDAKRALRRYLETTSDRGQEFIAWQRLAELCHLTSEHYAEAYALVEMSRCPTVPFAEISNAANIINRHLASGHLMLDSEEKREMISKLIAVMEARFETALAGATTCSRLAWLYLHIGKDDRARYYVNLGLKLEGNNEYCWKLAKTLLMV